MEKIFRVYRSAMRLAALLAILYCLVFALLRFIAGGGFSGFLSELASGEKREEQEDYLNFDDREEKEAYDLRFSQDEIIL